MAQNHNSTRPKNENVKAVLTKIHRIFVDHSSNNKIPKHKFSHASSNQEIRQNWTQEPVTPSIKNVERAFAIFKSDTFICIYNVNKNMKELDQTNGSAKIKFDFQFTGELTMLEGAPLYPCLDRDTFRPLPCIKEDNIVPVGDQNSEHRSFSEELNETQTQHQVRKYFLQILYLTLVVV